MNNSPSSQSRPTRSASVLAWVVGAVLASSVLVAAAVDARDAWLNWQSLGPRGVGMPTPSFRAHTLDGDRFDQRSLAGDPVALVFFATWCGACERQMPDWRELARRHREEGLRVILVNTDRDGDQEQLVREYLASHELDFDELEIVLDSGVMQRAFGASMLPHSVLIGRDATLRHVHQGVVMRAVLDPEVAALAKDG